jgi:hypothetical protein
LISFLCERGLKVWSDMPYFNWGNIVQDEPPSRMCRD